MLPLLQPEAIRVDNEFDQLELVMLHRPGKEIDRLTISNREELLFEDIPYLAKMQAEHDQFAEKLRSEGVTVLYLSELLARILKEDSTRSRLVFQVSAQCANPQIASIVLDHYSHLEIANLLVEGLTRSELKEKSGYDFTDCDERSAQFLIAPVPNLYFMRDPAAVIGSQIISSKMHYRARVQESLIMKEILQRHTLFSESQIIFGKEEIDDRPFTIEGGDIIVLSRNAVAIGRSERTRSETIRRIARRLFKEGAFQRVYEVTIPARREYMHLDTVFTVIGPGLVVAYPGVMEHVVELRRYEPLVAETDHGEDIIAMPIDEVRKFNTVLEEEFGGYFEVVHTGDNHPLYSEREQRSDGTNVLALGPRKVITYDRNHRTNDALRSRGVKVIEIEGSELVRGLGGPRCMSMPLRRTSEPPKSQVEQG
jgi:arginine deiminase